MHVLSLLGGSGLAGTDSPYGLIGDDNIAEVLCAETQDATLEGFLDALVLDVGLTLLQYLAYAEDNLQTVLQRQLHRLFQLLKGLLLIGAAL